MLPLADIFWLQPALPTPIAGLVDLIGKTLISFDFIDLVLWFPQLQWSELLATLGALLAWKLVADQADRALSRRLRELAAPWLAAVAARYRLGREGQQLLGISLAHRAFGAIVRRVWR